MPIPTMLSLTSTPTFPGDPAQAMSTSDGVNDDVQLDGENDGNIKTILECVFISAAVFALVFALLMRMACLRRAGRRPIKDFLKPLSTIEHSPSPLPSPTATRTNYTCHTLTLPLTPHVSATQMTYAAGSNPILPISAHTRNDPGIEAMAQHLAGRSRRPPTDRVDTLPLYDSKDVPPQYKDVVCASMHSDTSSSGHQSSARDS